jgi:hypothetical protein
MRQAQRRPQPQSAQQPAFESTPWVARELVVEEPQRQAGTPLALADNDHVVDAALDGEAIRRAR